MSEDAAGGKGRWSEFQGPARPDAEIKADRWWRTCVLMALMPRSS